MALELPKFGKKEKSAIPMREKSVILKISQFFEN